MQKAGAVRGATRGWRRWVIGGLGLLAGPALAALTVADLPETVFARIGIGKERVELSLADYRQALHKSLRERYYHGKVPEAEQARFRHEAARALITKVLLVQEARRRGYQPERERVEQTLAQMLADYRKRYGERKEWPATEKELAVTLRTFLENQSLLIQLKTDLTKVPDPDPAAVEAYYRQHPDKFTSPEQWRVAVILLRVAPSSAPEVWKQAQAEGQRIYEQLQNGADFAELARLHSADESAEQGGDMGYLHRGMLAPPVESALAELAPGETTPPLTLLQGVAIFRLLERKPPVRHPFARVAKRARELYLREARQRPLDGLIARLWETTPIVVNRRHYTAAPAKSDQAGANDRLQP